MKKLMTGILVTMLAFMLFEVPANASNVPSEALLSNDVTGNTSLGANDQKQSDDTIPSNISITQKQYKKNIKGVKKRSFNHVLRMANSGRSFILFVGFSECPHCRKFSPVMKEFLRKNKHTANVYYLNMNVNAMLPNMSKKRVSSFNAIFQKPFIFIGTPTIVVISGGHVIAGAVGDTTTLEQLTQLLNVYLNVS